MFVEGVFILGHAGKFHLIPLKPRHAGRREEPSRGEAQRRREGGEGEAGQRPHPRWIDPATPYTAAIETSGLNAFTMQGFLFVGDTSLTCVTVLQRRTGCTELKITHTDGRLTDGQQPEVMNTKQRQGHIGVGKEGLKPDVV